METYFILKFFFLNRWGKYFCNRKAIYVALKKLYKLGWLLFHTFFDNHLLKYDQKVFFFTNSINFLNIRISDKFSS